MKIAFPAIYRQEKDSDAINIVFPDILGAVSCGYGYENAMFMARDLLKVSYKCNFDNCRSATPSSLSKMKKLFSGDTIIMIEVDV